ncbi:MAG TPA: flavoprotein [bacterium]|nr:flavoprotein [bacterium]
MKKQSPRKKRLPNKTILHILSGSIAAYKAGDLIQVLRDEGARVICVMTESAKHFVTPLVLRALSGEKVYHDFFSADTPYDVLHTSLAEEADAILISPASADFIARLAAGMADDLASCIVLAARRPIVIVPAMNDHMYTHPLTQRNLGTLRQAGYQVIDPIEGHLVCGKEAIGHISENPAILDTLSRLLSSKK